MKAHEKQKAPILNPWFMLGIGLYWGEGSKGVEVGITNCDSDLIKKHMQWIKQFFNEDFERFAITIHHYDKGRDEEIKSFWKDKLNLEEVNFCKSVIAISKLSERKKGNTQLFGTAHINCRGKFCWRIKCKIKKTMDILAHSE